MEKEKLFTKSAFKVALHCPWKLYYYRNTEKYTNANSTDRKLRLYVLLMLMMHATVSLQENRVSKVMRKLCRGCGVRNRSKKRNQKYAT